MLREFVWVIRGTKSPCQRVPPFSKNLETGSLGGPASRVAMDTSSLLLAFGPPLTSKAPAPKLIVSDEFNQEFQS